MMDHLRIHHREQHDAVVVGNSKGLTLAAFNAQRNEPHVRALLGNSTVRESTDISPATADVTPKTGNAAGASLHEGSMARHAVMHALFQKPSPQEAGAAGPESQLHQYSQVGGQPFTVVETTRTSLPDIVTAGSSLLGNPCHVRPCRTFVLSCWSSGLFTEGQLVVGQLDSSSLHA